MSKYAVINELFELSINKVLTLFESRKFELLNDLSL